MEEWLVSIKQPKAAQKFKKHHTTDRKNKWMLADSKHASTNNNNAQEGHQKHFKAGTQGICSTKMHSDPYISVVCSFVSKYSKESHSEFAKAPHGLGSLQCIPIPSKLDFDLIM